MHVDKPGIEHLLLISLGAVAVSLEDGRGFEHVVGPLLDRFVVRDRAVIALDGERDVLELQPAAG